MVVSLAGITPWFLGLGNYLLGLGLQKGRAESSFPPYRGQRV
jgi:hypothetical protein